MTEIPKNNDIIGKVPNWLIRSGSSVLLILIVVIIIMSFLIRYPEVVSCEIKITSNSQPFLLTSKSSGSIVIGDSLNGKRVEKGEFLGYLKNEIDYKKIKQLKQYLKRIKTNRGVEDEFVDEFGIYTNYVSKIKLNLDRLNFYLKKNNESYKIKNLENQLFFQKRLLKKQKEMFKNEIQFLKLEEAHFKRDSILYETGALSLLNYQVAEQNYLRKKSDLEFFKKEAINLEFSISNIEFQIEELNNTFLVELKNLDYNVLESLDELTTVINQWEYNQVLKSPINGSVYLSKVWENNQQVNLGDEILYVLPDSSKTFGFAHVNQEGFGRVSIGQKVQIKLHDFPFQEYGILEGVVAGLSPIYTDSGYLVKIDLPNGLQTVKNKQLKFYHEMKGSCEIITHDLNLIERLFAQLLKLKY